MSSSLRRGALAATALVLPLATLAACGAGGSAQTLDVKPNSAATAVGAIKVQNIVVVTQPHGAEGPAAVTGKVFNTSNTAQTLQSITLPGTDAGVRLKPAKGSGPVTVPALGAVQLGGTGHASAMIKDGLPAGKNGNAEKVVFTLSKTGEVGVRALVVPATGFYAQVAPTAPATPSTPPSPGGSPSGSASGSPASSGSRSPSGSVSDSPSGGTESPLAGGGSGITG